MYECDALEAVDYVHCSIHLYLAVNHRELHLNLLLTQYRKIVIYFISSSVLLMGLACFHNVIAYLAVKHLVDHHFLNQSLMALMLVAFAYWHVLKLFYYVKKKLAIQATFKRKRFQMIKSFYLELVHY